MSGGRRTADIDHVQSHRSHRFTNPPRQQSDTALLSFFVGWAETKSRVPAGGKMTSIHSDWLDSFSTNSSEFKRRPRPACPLPLFEKHRCRVSDSRRRRHTNMISGTNVSLVIPTHSADPKVRKPVTVDLYLVPKILPDRDNLVLRRLVFTSVDIHWLYQVLYEQSLNCQFLKDKKMRTIDTTQLANLGRHHRLNVLFVASC